MKLCTHISIFLTTFFYFSMSDGSQIAPPICDKEVVTSSSPHKNKHDCQCKTPTIEIEYISEEDPTHQDLAILNPGFSKWLFWLHGFPINTPITFSVKRLFQLGFEGYIPLGKFFFDEQGNLISAEDHRLRCSLSCGANGYLPGEVATFRFATEDEKICKEITLIPQPIIIEKSDGSVFLEAELVAIKPTTIYCIEIIGVEKDEEYTFQSISGPEKLKCTRKGPITQVHYPEVIGMVGGINTLTFTFKKNEKYVVKLPWGIDLFDYNLRTAKPYTNRLPHVLYTL